MYINEPVDENELTTETGLRSIKELKDGYSKYKASLNTGLNEDMKQTLKQNELSNDSVDSVAHKLDVIELNNYWNDSNEDLIVSIGENAASYKWMHEKASSYYSLRHQIVSFMMVLLTIALSAESIILTENTETIDIIRSVFTYLVTIVSIFQSFLKYETKAESHKNIALKYSVLYNNIRQVMTMYRKTRPIANDYIQKSIKIYDGLIMESLEIPVKIVSKYKKIVGVDISQPTIADRIQNINIISETPIKSMFKKNETEIPVLEPTELEMRQINKGSTFDMMRDYNKKRIIDDDITDAEIMKVKSAKLRYELERLNRHE